ncbi:hypothetical protein PI125_g23386 [Phytophthora idaei]|nr:hypothetical protein PI125_g23386 [Phytophthora idaei]KAG3139744.1 hypothetical protein PI126_g16319 [Phytophthora idaei]
MIQYVEDGLAAVNNQWVHVFRRIQKNEDDFIEAATKSEAVAQAEAAVTAQKSAQNEGAIQVEAGDTEEKASA